MWSKFERYLPPSALTVENADTKALGKNSLDVQTIFDSFMDEDNEYDPLSKSRLIKVKGAGSGRVNGTYQYCGEHEDFSVFCKNSHRNGDPCKYWLYKQHQNSYWYISASSDSSEKYFPSIFNRTFYKSRSINRTRKNLPSSRDSWIEHGSGKHPPPDVLCTGEKLKDNDNVKKWTLKLPPKRKYDFSDSDVLIPTST
jgi:hypothetical protein